MVEDTATAELHVSPDLGNYKRGELTDRNGLSYAEFRAELRPRFVVVWLHIGAGYGALSACALATVLGARVVHPWLAACVAAVVFGYGQAYIQLFFHEAAHFNIAPSRRWNDRLANVFIGSMTGQDIQSYREIHFGHHRHLGKPTDPERTYFDPLNVRFLLEAFLGVKSLRVMLLRKDLLRQSGTHKESARLAPRFQMAFALALHAALLATLFKVQLGYLAFGWIAGTGLFLPFFTALRQLLEHRSDSAHKDTNYSQVAHGEVTRMFSPGLLGSTLGGAGFDRHLLHHWDPQVSYTRLPELERFLLHTKAAPAMCVKESYIATFGRLFGK